MRRDNINYFLVGLFTLVSLAVLLVALYKITGRVGQAEPYHVYFHNIAGLGKGTHVTYEGYQIGYVERLVPEQTGQGTRYRVEVLIRRDWRIPEDSRARIHSTGLLGDTVIEIAEGESERHLEPGAAIAGAPAQDVFAVLNEVAAEVGGLTRDSLRPLLDNLNTQVSGIGGEVQARLPGILGGLESMVGRLDNTAARLEAILDADTETRVDSILVNVDDMSRDLAGLSRGLQASQQALDALLADAHGMVRDNDADVRRSVVGLRRSVEASARAIDAILHDLRQASRNMNEFSRQIRGNPGLLIRSRPQTGEE
ncbi:MAG: hypothetical protein CMN57_01080 [Gammaproteobacteria bacterium]|nr:hypothetical protein [Gammaproteobacteria bacterium]